MRHVRNPMDVIYYYVPDYDDYFEYIEHRVNGILLNGDIAFGTPFVVPEDKCRIADYEEVRQFHNG